MHVTAYYRSPKEPNWRAVSYGTGSNLRWATGSCFVTTHGQGYSYEEVKVEDAKKGEYDMEARVTRKDADGNVAAEWRIVPSPGSRPDADAPPFVPPTPRVAPAVRAMRAAAANGKAPPPAVAAQVAPRGVQTGTSVERAKTPPPQPLPPIPPRTAAGPAPVQQPLVRRPVTRRPLSRKSLDNAQPAPIVKGPPVRRKLTVSTAAQNSGGRGTAWGKSRAKRAEEFVD